MRLAPVSPEEANPWSARPFRSGRNSPKPPKPIYYPGTLLFDEEDPLVQPEGNIATSSSKPIARESRASPPSDSEDVFPDGQSMKGHVDVPPPTP